MTKTIARKFGINVVLAFIFVMSLIYMDHNQIAAARTAPPNVPVWTHHDAHRFPNCHKADGTIGNGELVVVNNAGRRYREQFGVAWANNHDDNPNNDLWVIGVCE